MIKQTGYSFWASLLVLGLLLLTNSGLTTGFQPKTTKSWTYPDGYDPHGGYLDRVTFIVYQPADEQLGLQALQAGLIYAWDEQVENTVEIEAVDGLGIRSEPSDRYQMFCLNCGRFPTNITAYRQGLAYALDKITVIQSSTGGMAFHQDCALPITLGNWTFEPILVETYYRPDIDKANATLEAAGFRDLDGNGWRDFDMNNNSILDAGDILDQDFAIELYHTAGYAPSGNAVEIAALCLNLCGIMATVVPLDFFEILDRITEGDYWLGCFTFTNVNSPEFLYEMFHSSSDFNQWYFGGYNNSVYDSYAENMMSASTQGEANDWAWFCQWELWQDVPMIVCYNDVITHAYRTDRWEGYVNMATRNRICNGYSLVHLRLKESAGGPFGCFPTEYVLSLNEGLNHTNWLMSNSIYTDKVFQLVYEELWNLSPFDLSPQSGLAYAWEIQPTVASGDIQNGEKYTFHLYENATWHDGVPVTSTDVAFSVD
ncbi:MAG: ABC transporter substrate-binding protein, partial [Candidatus Hermodarchaeota archaeon]